MFNERMESQYGTRYIVLSLLPYYDCIAMITIDAMHNFFLGTSKMLTKLWGDLGHLNKETLVLIQSRVDSAQCPGDVGKIRCKIDKFSFDGFTAEEFKNWTIIFSVYALHDILPDDDTKCWRYFVLACYYLCNGVISKDDLIVADNFLMKFCISFENLYGNERVTHNMHLHGHLVSCVRQYGPLYSFWLFSFERYNGILGNISKNERNIEILNSQRGTLSDMLAKDYVLFFYGFQKL